ncbi:hypothetical protein SAMN05216431_105135 [Ligilactobacillus sp. WC1T17]|uniref:DUF554 domain-containing protein n=1 Tax=Ligilactobacillus ruminis TaxID=1623 RepID=A0ABY1ABC6_9LACO|nr:hypothetical protein SAMN05216431_105135 [Ligilactobacillus ruminis]
MIGLGTLVDCLALICGGFLGMFFQRLISDKIQKAAMQAIGLGALFLGISGTLNKMLIIKNGQFQTQDEMMLIVTLALGTMVGEAIDIDGWFQKLSSWLYRYAGQNKQGSRFTEGFLAASLTSCIGAMAIVGSLQDGLAHDPSLLFSKAVIDLIVNMLYAASFGLGPVFAFVPVLCYQGALTLLASLLKPLLTQAALNGLTLVGSTLIFVIGLNLLLKQQIKVANMLPALLFVPLYVVLV